MKMFFLLAVSLSACATAGTAKNPCGLVQTAKDPFVGEQRGFVLYLDNGNYTALGLTETAGKYALRVMLADYGDSLEVARAGQKGEFALGDGVVTLASLKESKPVASVHPNIGVFTQWQLEFRVSKEEAAQFAAQPLKAVKVDFGAKPMQLPVADKYRERIQNSVACMVH